MDSFGYVPSEEFVDGSVCKSNEGGGGGVDMVEYVEGSVPGKPVASTRRILCDSIKVTMKATLTW